MAPKTLSLFGSSKRTRYLIGVAMLGPISGRALGRSLEIDSASLPDLYRHFYACRVVRRNIQGDVEIDASFQAADELLVILNALGGRRLVVLPNPEPPSTKWSRRARLFGTTGRTRALIALAHLGTANLKTLAAVAAVPERTIAHVVRHFAREGIVVTECDAQERVVSLSPDHPVAQPLRALLLKMAPSIPGLPTRASIALASMAERKKPERVAARALRARLPFGTAAQSTAVELVARTPMRVAELTRATSLSPHTVHHALDTLEDHGLVVTERIGRGRSSSRWARLNERHPLHDALMAFVKTLPVEADDRLREMPPKALRKAGSVKPGLPGWRELRARVVLHVHAVGELDLGTLAKRMRRTDRTALRTTARKLAAVGLVEFGIVGGRETLRAVSDAASLDALLTAMRRFLDGST